MTFSHSILLYLTRVSHLAECFRRYLGISSTSYNTIAHIMGKKRKAPLVDLEGERTLYHSFVGAANAVSQLYTQAAQQQRQAASAAARQALVSLLAASSNSDCSCACLVAETMVRRRNVSSAMS